MNSQGANIMYNNRYDQQAYMKQYYKDHREKMIKQSIQWQKNNPGKVSIQQKRHRERRDPENKTNYGRKGQKVLSIRQYGKDLESKKDAVTWGIYKKRLFCLDCFEFEICKGEKWEDCSYKVEVLKIIENKI